MTPLSRFPIRWIVRPDVWPTPNVLTLEDLERIPVLTYVRTSSPHAHVRALFANRGVEPRICSFPSVQSIVQLVKDGFGVAAIPPIFVQRDIEAGGLKLCEGPALPPLVVTMTRPRASSPAVAAVDTIIREVAMTYCKAAGPPWAVDLQEDLDTPLFSSI